MLLIVFNLVTTAIINVEEYEKCLGGITLILREAWNTSQHTQDNKEKIQALYLAKECYSMKLELLINATVVDDAVRFVIAHKHDDNNTDNEEIKTSPIEEVKEEESTTNQVFSLVYSNRT